MSTTAENALLLLLWPATGQPMVPWASLDLGLAGGVLADLVHAERITARPARFGPAAVHVVDRTPTGDPVLDAALLRVDERVRSATALIPRVADGLRQALARGLTERESLRIERRRSWGGLVTSERYVVDREQVAAANASLRRVLLEGEAADDATQRLLVVLAPLGMADGAMWVRLDNRQRRAVRDRARAMTASSWISAAVASLVRRRSDPVVPPTTWTT